MGPLLSAGTFLATIHSLGAEGVAFYFHLGRNSSCQIVFSPQRGRPKIEGRCKDPGRMGKETPEIMKPSLKYFSKNNLCFLRGSGWHQGPPVGVLG